MKKYIVVYQLEFLTQYEKFDTFEEALSFIQDNGVYVISVAKEL